MNDSTDTRIAIVEAILPTLATKADLSGLRADMQAELAGMRGDLANMRVTVAELRTDIHKAEANHVKWSVALAIGIVAMIVGFLNFSKNQAPQPIVINVPAVQMPAKP